MPIALAIKSYFPVQTVSLSHSLLEMILLPKVLLWKLPIQRPSFGWFIQICLWTRVKDIAQLLSFISSYMHLNLELKCTSAAELTLNGYLERVQGGKHLQATLNWAKKWSLEPNVSFYWGIALEFYLTWRETLKACNYV